MYSVRSSEGRGYKVGRYFGLRQASVVLAACVLGLRASKAADDARSARPMRVFLSAALFLSWLLCMHVRSVQAEDAVAIGDVAPKLGIEKLLQAPPGATADLEALRGKVVLIEFWATWCGPCITAFADLNALAKTFESQPVVFLSVTDEAEGFIRRFLKSQPLRTWIGLDADRSAFREFHITAIPRTVIVNRNGRVVAITHPSNLSEQVIRNVLDGKEIALPQEASGGSFDTVKMAADELSHAQFSKSVVGEAYAFEFDGTHIFMRGGSLKESLIPWAYEESTWRILDKSGISDQVWTFSAKIPHNDRARLFKLWRVSFEATFGLSAEKRMIDRSVFVMKRSDLPGSAITTSELDRRVPPGRLRSGVLKGEGDSTENIAAMLERKLRVPVVDETNLAGRFDYQLLFDDETEETLIESVRKQLGFDLTHATRKVEMLVIEPSAD